MGLARAWRVRRAQPGHGGLRSVSSPNSSSIVPFTSAMTTAEGSWRRESGECRLQGHIDSARAWRWRRRSPVLGDRAVGLIGVEGDPFDRIYGGSSASGSSGP